MIHIYLITNEVTGKYYVGQTSYSIDKRFRDHISSSRSERGRGCPRLKRSMRKHGPEAFSIQELATANTNESGDCLETLWITVLNSTDTNVGYNSCPTGKSVRGFKWDKESRAKLSKSKMGNTTNVGRKVSEETKAKISKTLMGHEQKPNSGCFQKGHGLGMHISEAHKEAVRKAQTGKVVSEETRRRLSTLRLGKAPWNKGLKTSLEVRQKQSESAKHRGAQNVANELI